MSKEPSPRQQSASPAREVKLPAEVHIRAPGVRSVVKTVEQALHAIDRDMSSELTQLPRWTFARALLVEAQRTQKSRDLNAAYRQFKQALSNEKWLVDKG